MQAERGRKDEGFLTCIPALVTTTGEISILERRVTLVRRPAL